jgi:tRNA threonylcarbamoyladenosine biosynthesis protein TsaE
MRRVHLETATADETARKVTGTLRPLLKPGTVIALNGELGCGKTVIAKALAAALEVNEDITSPTFTLLEEYEGRLPFYHFDLYRIESAAELEHLGFDEYWNGDGVCVIEWADRVAGLLPCHTVSVRLAYLDDDRRSIDIEYSAD